MDFFANRLEKIGAYCIEVLHFNAAFVFMLTDAAAGMFYITTERGHYLRLQLWQQVYFTAIQPLRLIMLVGVIFGIVVAFPFKILGVNDLELMATIYQVAILYTLIPLMSALIVIGRSGMAITTEIAHFRIDQTVECLLAMGVEPNQFLVLPRVLGMIISLILICIWMAICSMIGSSITFHLQFSVTFVSVLKYCLTAVTLNSLLITGSMLATFAALIVSTHCYYGFLSLNAVDLSRNIPRAFVGSLVSCLLVSVIFMVISNG